MIINDMRMTGLFCFVNVVIMNKRLDEMELDEKSKKIS